MRKERTCLNETLSHEALTAPLATMFGAGLILKANFDLVLVSHLNILFRRLILVD